jgi:hypothetical protein
LVGNCDASRDRNLDAAAFALSYPHKLTLEHSNTDADSTGDVDAHC